MKKTLLFIIISLSITAIKAQSAWTVAKDELYTQLNFTNIGPYNRLFVDGDKTAELLSTLTDRTYQVFAEYGLTDKTTLSVNIPFKSIKNEYFDGLGDLSATDQENALGNLTFGVRHNLYNRSFVVSGSLYAEAKTGTYDSSTGIATGLDAWSIIPSISVGKGTNNFFAQANAGVALRTNDYSHSFQANGEAGYKFFDTAWLIARLDYITSFKNGDVILPLIQSYTALYANDQEYAGYSFKTIVELTDQLGITAATASAFSANLLPRKASLSFGLYYKFDTKKDQ